MERMHRVERLMRLQALRARPRRRRRLRKDQGDRQIAAVPANLLDRQFAAERPNQRRMADSGIVCSMSRSGNVWNNAAMESFFSSLKTERTASKIYRTRNEARADVFDYIERFYNATRRHSTIGYVRPVEFERKVGLG